MATTSTVTTSTTSTSSRIRRPSIENGALLDDDEGHEMNDIGGVERVDADADDEDDEGADALREIDYIYRYYVMQDALPWWRRKRNTMVNSLIVKPPWAEIIRAVCFLFIGSALLTIGSLIYTGNISFMEPRAGITMIVAGFLLFIPGIYVTVIAIRACLGIDGTTYDDIPGASM